MIALDFRDLATAIDSCAVPVERLLSPPGELLPRCDDHIDVLRIELDAADRRAR